MEDTPEVYHYSIAEAAELLGCEESHLLQFAAFSGLPVHVFITDALVDKDGNQKGSFSNYFQLAKMHVRALIANGSIKINPVLLMEAIPVQEGLGVNYADFVLHHLPLENGLRTYAVFPEMQEITISANRVVVLAKHLTDFQNRNAGKPSAVPEKASSEIGPVAAHQTVSTEGDTPASCPQEESAQRLVDPPVKPQRKKTSYLATEEEITNAFGCRADLFKDGHKFDWFKESRVKGKGGKNSVKPKFDPYFFAANLPQASYGLGITEKRAWTILKSSFPDRYLEVESYDPRIR